MNGRSLGDTAELNQFGYPQQLKRTIRGFSSFAFSFSLISLTTGIFANFGSGIRQFGPAVLWSWLLVALGQFLIALIVAELAANYPLAGYGYQWTSRLINPHYGFFVGWLLLVQFLTGFPGVCAALGEYLLGFPGFAHTFAIPGEWITVGLITLIAVIHIFGIRVAAFFNNAGVVAELVGSLVVALVLLTIYGFTRRDAWSFLFQTTNSYTGRPGGFGGFALSLLLGAWCLTGFEAAADMAEETHRPSEVIPKAILTSELVSGFGGFVVLAGFLLAMPSLTSAQQSATPLSDILRARLGIAVSSAVMITVYISIFACGLASMAATTRLIFSMARDNVLPCSSLWKRIDSKRGTPVAAIVMVWALSSILVLALRKLDVITSVSAVAGYLGYAGILFAALWGMRRKPRATRATSFSLGRGQVPVGVAALLWSLFLTMALAIPEYEPGAGHMPAVASAVGLAAGALVYLTVVRSRLRRGVAGPPELREKL